MTRPSTLGLFALCASLAGCGGSSLSGPSDDVMTAPLVSHSGSFSGIMTRSGGASAALVLCFMLSPSYRQALDS